MSEVGAFKLHKAFQTACVPKMLASEAIQKLEAIEGRPLNEADAIKETESCLEVFSDVPGALLAGARQYLEGPILEYLMATPARISIDRSIEVSGVDVI